MLSLLGRCLLGTIPGIIAGLYGEVILDWCVNSLTGTILLGIWLGLLANETVYLILGLDQ